MKYLLLFIWVLCAAPVFSQVYSPVGKWILTEHFIEKTQADGIRSDENCYYQEFTATLNFDADGTFIKELDGEEFRGKWKLKKDLISLKLLYDNGTKIIVQPLRNETLNFELPLRITEFYPPLYSNDLEHLYGGTSSYIRVEDDGNAPFMKNMIGTWITCTSRTFDTTNNCDGDNYSTTFFFNEDDTYTTDHEYITNGQKYIMHGTWKMIDENSLVLVRASEGNMKQIPIQIDLIWINDTLAYVKGIESLKRGPTVYRYYRKKE